MSKYEVVVPKLGESVIEVTITRWLKNEGETIQEDEPIVEIATDKVDSEISSPVTGKLIQKIFNEGDMVPIGTVFAILELADSVTTVENTPATVEKIAAPASVVVAKTDPAGNSETIPVQDDHENAGTGTSSGTRFYSPLVRSIALQENISFSELDLIAGTGKDDRLTKQDLLSYLQDRKLGIKPVAHEAQIVSTTSTPVVAAQSIRQIIPGEDRIVEMDRIRLLIANHMIKSVQTSAHVTSFQEVDMTHVVQWRDKNKDEFLKREKEKLTFTPIFIEAIAKSIRDYPMINVSVDGTRIVVHKNINIGMAVALPNFNLIVPVVRSAHEKSLLGLVKSVNDLAERARAGKLVPDEISGGTISITNLGSFGTLMGTPIINQPQTAIVAVGAIKKRVVVIETPDGDTIAIRPMMMVSVTYDHRVIDGSLGGQFLNKLVHYLENFDNNQPI